MANSYVSRAHMMLALCLPLAVLLGVQLANGTEYRSSQWVVVLLLGLLCVPLLMNWYHPLLLMTWNAAITPYFLPGQPFLWMLVAFMGLGFAIANRFTSPDARFVIVPSLNRAMLLLLAVVAITALIKGGVRGVLALRAFGSSQYGAKGYFYIFGAIAGYFVMTSRRMPKERAGLFVGLFFLGALTALVPNVAYVLGPKWAFLYYLFPPVYAYEQAAGDYTGSQFARIYGLTFASNGFYCFLLARYGLQGIFDLSKPHRMVMFIAAALGCLFCGFRSFMLLFLLTVISQFFAEKLFRPRVLLALAAFGILVGGGMLAGMDRLPSVVQRSISFVPDWLLPVDIDPAIRLSADRSSEWRLQMWGDVLPDVPRYLLVGKGYSLDPTELYLALEKDKRGWTHYGWALVTGAYHNGALTLIIPFGIWGMLAFLILVVVTLRYLYWNYRYGDPDLTRINTFLLAYFIAKLVYYFVVFGSFYTDLFVFTGIAGISVSLNGPPAVEAERVEPELIVPEFAPAAER